MAGEAAALSRSGILFDPQTSGGLLAALPVAVAEDICTALLERGEQAAIIGRLSPDTPGLSLAE